MFNRKTKLKTVSRRLLTPLHSSQLALAFRPHLQITWDLDHISPYHMADLSQQAVTTSRLEVVEYMGSLEGNNHPALSRGPRYDSETNRWLYGQNPGAPELYAAQNYCTITWY